MLGAPLSKRRRLDTLFVITSLSLFVVGAAGFVDPQSWSVFFDDGGEVAARHIRGRLHLKEVIRLFSGFLVGSAYSVWTARTIAEGDARRGVTRGLFCSSALVTVALAQAHRRQQQTLSRGTHGVALFFALSTVGYAWFAFFQPPSVYRGLGREA